MRKRKTNWFEIPEMKRKGKDVRYCERIAKQRKKLFGGFFRKQSHVKYFSKTYTNAIV